MLELSKSRRLTISSPWVGSEAADIFPEQGADAASARIEGPSPTCGTNDNESTVAPCLPGISYLDKQGSQPFDLFSNQASASGLTVWINDLKPLAWDHLQGILSFSLPGINRLESSLNNLQVATTNVGIWASGTYFAQVSDSRWELGAMLAEHYPTTTWHVIHRDLEGSIEWESEIEAFGSVATTADQLASIPPWDFVYEAGELLFTSFVRRLTRSLERHSLYAQTLRNIASYVSSFLKFSRGLAGHIIGVFLNERSWYLHHTAHPPDQSSEAVEGRSPATLRACLRLLPS